MLWRQISAVIAVAALAACSQPRRTEDKEPTRVVAAADTALAPLVDGVLAERPGIQGPIRVEQRDGRRLLIIGDTIHAAVPWSATGPDPAARDPLVELLRLVRPGAKTALVVGLGSGRTATELAQGGLAVTAIELEKAVIELARGYFGYRGEAIAAEGLAHLRAHSTSYDLVLMDAFAGTHPPPDLITPAALALLRERTLPGGVTALRMLSGPRDPVVADIERRLAQTAGPRHYQHLLGSGVGSELQNLYLLASDTPLNWRNDAGLVLWPIQREGARSADGADPGSLFRKVTLVGYLHRTSDGALAIDLAHWEMGAARYLVTNAPEQLGAALPAGARFPTQGDISSDGDTSVTLRWLLGGGGVKRSDVRFSPIVAAVTGTVQLISVIHPDAASALPTDLRGNVTDERLPWGGALYRLDVTEVHWTIDMSKGQRVSAAMKAAMTAAAQRAAAGDLSAASLALDEAAKAFTLFGAQSTLVPSYQQIVALRGAIVAEQVYVQRGGFAAAAACDRMRERVVRGDPGGDLVALRHGFEACAVTGYERAAGSDKGADSYDAAARLLYLLDPVRLDQASDAARHRAKLRAKLEKKFGAQPLQVPPRWVELQRSVGAQIQ
jgi:hypothetical protein